MFGETNAAGKTTTGVLEIDETGQGEGEGGGYGDEWGISMMMGTGMEAQTLTVVEF